MVQNQEMMKAEAHEILRRGFINQSTVNDGANQMRNAVYATFHSQEAGSRKATQIMCSSLSNAQNHSTKLEWGRAHLRRAQAVSKLALWSYIHVAHKTVEGFGRDLMHRIRGSQARRWTNESQPTCIADTSLKLWLHML